MAGYLLTRRWSSQDLPSGKCALVVDSMEKMSTGIAVNWWRVLTIVSVFWLATWSGMGAEQDDITYRTLVQRVMGGDFTVDFRSLRLACMKSSHCEPRGTKEDLGAMNSAEQNHQLNRVVEIAGKLIERGFVNLEAHATSAAAYAEMNEPAKAKFHRDVTTALTRSIFDSGDGKTKESAFEVICDREEYVMMAALGLPYFGSSVSKTRVAADGPHTYERWEVRNPETGQNAVVFFNIDAFSPTKSRVGDQ